MGCCGMGAAIKSSDIARLGPHAEIKKWVGRANPASLKGPSWFSRIYAKIRDNGAFCFARYFNGMENQIAQIVSPYSVFAIRLVSID